MRVRVTMTCEYDVVDGHDARAEAYGGEVTDEAVLLAEAELVEDDPGYVLTLGDNWCITVEKADGLSAHESHTEG